MFVFSRRPKTTRIKIPIRRSFRVCQTKRDGKDYQSMSGVTHMLNNAESVLQKDDVKDAIDGYEELFTGARKEVSNRDTLHCILCSTTHCFSATDCRVTMLSL